MGSSQPLYDARELPVHRRSDPDEPLDACAGVLAALAGAIAAMQLFVAIVTDAPPVAILHAALLLPILAWSVAPTGSRLRRGLQPIVGWAGAAVWLALVPSAGGAAPVAVAMTALSALVARTQAGFDDPQDIREPVEQAPSPAGWIDDDSEGWLTVG